jgi:hypothetical protein
MGHYRNEQENWKYVLITHPWDEYQSTVKGGKIGRNCPVRSDLWPRTGTVAVFAAEVAPAETC